MQTGQGKLTNHDAVANWFATDLSIPFPHLNAWMAAGTEFFGGLLLMVGLGSRLAAAPLAFTMLVAFATSDLDAVRGNSLTQWDSLLEAGPFLFLLASLIVLMFGPGALSIEALIARWWKSRAAPDQAHASRPMSRSAAQVWGAARSGTSARKRPRSADTSMSNHRSICWGARPRSARA